MSGDLVLAARLALRELRGGLAGFYLLIACIALGVAGIAGVGTLADGLRHGFAAQGRSVLGGDLSFALAQRRADEAERALLGSQGRIGEVATLRSLARRMDSERTVLVELKAVDRAYPLVGELLTGRGGKLQDELADGALALVDPILLQRLGLAVGDRFRLGRADIRIADTIALEPDRLGGRIGFGPRVLLSLDALEKTGLVQPGSLVRWQVNLTLDGDASEARLAAVKQQVLARFPEAGFGVTDRLAPSPAVGRAIDRFSQFLTMVGIAALFIGGIGVANAVASHMAKKREVIAVLKALGATSRQIFLLYLLHILFMAAAGIVLGLVLGTLAPAGLLAVFGAELPFPLHLRPSATTLLLAALYGFLCALVFMLWPIGSARRVRAAELFRAESATSEAGPGWQMIAAIVLLLAVLMGVTVFTASMKLIAFYVSLAFIGFFLGFRLVAAVIRRLAGRLPRLRNATLSLARAGLAAPTPLLRTVVPSIGIGVGMLVAVALVEHALRAELRTGLPAAAPDFFVLDIDKSETDAVRRMAEQAAPGVKVEFAPMLRGRLIELAGRPVESVKAAAGSEWVLRGDRGLTFAEQLPPGSTLAAGEWWPADYAGPPLVSFEQEAAKGLGLKLGDSIRINVLGRTFDARIASLRRVRWESLALNFVMLFSPNTLAGAPYKLLGTLSLPPHADAAVEGRLVTDIVSAYPGITPVSVRESLAIVDGVIERILVAIRLAGLVILLAGTLALAGALAATHGQRRHETVILKVLGATRWRILAAHGLEYLALSLVSAAAAVGAGGLVAYLIVTRLMQLDFAFSWLAVGQVTGVVVALVLPLGLIDTWRLLGRSAASELRRV